MKSKILSLNIGHPEEMFWEGKSVISSMKKWPTDSPLKVHFDHIDGDSFKNSDLHGTIDSVIYLMGTDALAEYSQLLGKIVQPGDAGENVTLECLQESQVEIGDEFQIGEVCLIATFPRIPCGKVNYRFQHAEAQQKMKDLGRSGFYGKITQIGQISKSDIFEKIRPSHSGVKITEVYQHWVTNRGPNADLYHRLKSVSTFPAKALAILKG